MKDNKVFSFIKNDIKQFGQDAKKGITGLLYMLFVFLIIGFIGSIINR